jgi:hypothetical protein
VVYEELWPLVADGRARLSWRQLGCDRYSQLTAVRLESCRLDRGEYRRRTHAARDALIAGEQMLTWLTHPRREEEVLASFDTAGLHVTRRSERASTLASADTAAARSRTCHGSASANLR